MPVIPNNNPFAGSFLQSLWSTDPTGMATPLGMAAAPVEAGLSKVANEARQPAQDALRNMIDHYLKGVDEEAGIHFLRGIRMASEHATTALKGMK